MAVYYVDSNATGANNGTSKTDAWVSLGSATGLDPTTDEVSVSHLHNEVFTANTTWTFPSDRYNLLRVISRDWSTDAPTPGAVIDHDTYDLALSGSFYFYGMTFKSGSTATGGDLFQFINTGGAVTVFENGTIDHSFGTPTFRVGRSDGTDIRITFVNSTVKLTTSNPGMRIRSAVVRFIGCTITTGSSANPIIDGNSALLNGTPPLVLFDGCDMSGMDPTRPFLDTASSVPADIVRLRNCKLPANQTWLNTADSSGGFGYLEIANSSDTDKNYIHERHHMQGSSQVIDTGVYLDAGASSGLYDGTTEISGLSWKITTNAGVKRPQLVFETHEFGLWQNSVGTSVTATVEILHDSTTDLDDSEIWLEVRALTTAGVPLGERVSNESHMLTGTPAPHPSSTAAWTGTSGLTNPRKQKLQVTFTPQERGFLIATVHVAKPSYTVWVNPRVTVA